MTEPYSSVVYALALASIDAGSFLNPSLSCFLIHSSSLHGKGNGSVFGDGGARSNISLVCTKISTNGASAKLTAVGFDKVILMCGKMQGASLSSPLPVLREITKYG